MGQQQLLLIALSVIIVGAAVAVGVNIVNTGAQQAVSDKFYQKASVMAAELGKKFKSPGSLGGFGGDLDGVSFSLPEAGALLGIKQQGASDLQTDEIYITSVSVVGSGYDVPDGVTGNNIDGIEVGLGMNGSTLTGTVFLCGNGMAYWDVGSNTSRPSS